MKNQDLLRPVASRITANVSAILSAILRNRKMFLVSVSVFAFLFLDHSLLSFAPVLLMTEPVVPPKEGKTPPKEEESDDEKSKKGFQRVITDKDNEIQKLRKEIEEKNKLIEEGKKTPEQLAEMQKTLDAMVKEKEIARLDAEYPDILPELLVGKTPEECEKIAEKQRSRVKKVYGDASFFSRKVWQSIDEIDAEIDRIKEDKSISSTESISRIRQLRIERVKLNS